jgi:hypothetical protein
MQVELAVQEVSGADRKTLSSIFHHVSLTVLLITVLVALSIWLLWIFMFVDEWIFALKDRRRKKRERRNLSKC